MERARGVKSLVHDAVDTVVDLVELGHESTSRTVMRALSLAGPVPEPARQIDALRRLITAGVLGSIKGVNHLVAALTDLGLDALASEAPEAQPLVPLRSDIVGTAPWVADAALGVVNGVVGDHLASSANGLDLGMRLRALERWIEADGQGAPEDAGPRIALLVHGLAATEWSWCMDAAQQLGDPASNYGTLLKADLGYTPVYARYNSGLHISQNGRALCRRLEALVARWPVPVEELLLVGHSMGGLVVRSACLTAVEEGAGWLSKVRRVITLGAPNQGAPLEKFGHSLTSLLAWLDLPSTAIPAGIVNGRSAGIKDLRHGWVRDEDWQPGAGRRPPRPPPRLPPQIDWLFVSATLGASTAHPASQILGDLLVRVESASGPRDAPLLSTVRHVGGVSHTGLQVHPAVYRLIREFLGDPA